MDEKELLEKTSFGESIAELEADKLKDYFYQTEYWRSIRNGSRDIVYGSKGSGKSAIYTSLLNDTDSLFDEGVIVSLAENPQGSTAFSNLVSSPPTSEVEFVRLWKIYFLVIATRVLDEYSINDAEAKRTRRILEDCNLVPAQNKLSSFLKACFDFVKSFKNGKEVSTTAEFDVNTGMYTGQKFSLTFGEPSKHNFEKGLIPVEHVYDILTQSLRKNNIALWIIIDRLDVAFVESEELEKNALRALFKVYLDLVKFDEIEIKIFLRDDIWQGITDGGFREASHITKSVSLTWRKDSLLNLVVRRLLDNDHLVSEYNLNKESILADAAEQEELFYKIFPDQVDTGAKKPSTLDWALSRTRDGNGINTPRELIQLFKHARVVELKRLESGTNEVGEGRLFSRQGLKLSVYELSKQRTTQTLYAEFPQLKIRIEDLRGDKAEQTIDTLSVKWALDSAESLEIAKSLVRIGFFEPIGNKSSPRYKVPFMYRPFLEITQGASSINL